MNKGILMETNRRYSVIMRSDGAFEKAAPVQGASIGEEVRYQSLPERKGFASLSGKMGGFPFRITAMACMLLLLVMPFYFVLNTNSTYAYVNIDINPSIELEIDEDLEVTAINPLNKDARLIVGKLQDYEGDKLNLVIDEIMEESEKLGLLSHGKNMLVGVSYLSGQTGISVLSTVDKYLMNNNQDWNVATFVVPEKVRKLAEKNQQSMNELIASGYAEPESALTTESGDVNEQERAIISSFYNTDEPEITITETEENVQAEEKPEEKQLIDEAITVEEATSAHPSELKGKNGTIHSQGKNDKSNGRPHNDDDEVPGKNRKDHKGPNGKAKGYYKSKKEHKAAQKKANHHKNNHGYKKNEKNNKKPNKNANDHAKNKKNK